MNHERHHHYYIIIIIMNVLINFHQCHLLHDDDDDLRWLQQTTLRKFSGWKTLRRRCRLFIFPLSHNHHNNHQRPSHHPQNHDDHHTHHNHDDHSTHENGVSTHRHQQTSMSRIILLMLMTVLTYFLHDFTLTISLPNPIGYFHSAHG